jgi:hypothetical protein
MLTKLLKPMLMLIKLAPLMVTQLGTPTLPPELDLKPPPSMHHTQIILFIEQHKACLMNEMSISFVDPFNKDLNIIDDNLDTVDFVVGA